MITLRKFFVVLLALTALVVSAYVVYEMTPERRAVRVVSKWKRLYDEFFEDPEREIRKENYRKREGKLAMELFEVACHCEPPVDRPGPLVGPWFPNFGGHKEGCLYSELIKEVTGYAMELERKWDKERERHALEESRR